MGFDLPFSVFKGFWSRFGRFLLLALAATLFASSGTPAAGRAPRDRAWSGTVTWVSDGDTLWVAPEGGGRPRKIRLDGIDAPEICQAWGSAARDALRQRALHRTVRVATRRLDDYRRELAKVDLGGEDLGGWMVERGHAWSYRYRHNPGPYVAEERSARLAKHGLFADSAALEPRAFRQSHGPCH